MDNRIRFKMLAAEAAVYGMEVTSDGLTFDSDYKVAADQLERSIERLVTYSRTTSQPAQSQYGQYDPSQRVGSVESELRMGPVRLRF